MKNKRLILLFLLLLFSMTSLQYAYSKNSKDKDKVKDKKEKEIKENNGKNKDKTEKIEKKIKSDFIYSEVLRKEIEKNIDKKSINSDKSITIQDKKYIEKQNKMTNCLKSLEKLQSKIDNIKKDIKIISLDNVENIKKQYSLFDDIKNSFENQNSKLLDDLNDQEKAMIKSQSDKIEESRKALDVLLSNFNKDLDKKNVDNKELFENAKEIENEIRVIYRQLRAIEWITTN